MEKTCRDCQQTKAASEFYPNNQKKDGLSTYCKPCFRTRQERYHEKAPPKILPPDGMKRCSTCKSLKPIEEFSNNRVTKDGKSYACKVCSVASVRAYHQRNPEKHRDYNREWARQNPTRQKDIRLKTNRGIDHGSYDLMFKAQSGLCDICESPPSNGQRMHVDHCHDTGKIRSLLCGRCNTGIGMFLHDPVRLEKAIHYIKRHSR